MTSTRLFELGTMLLFAYPTRTTSQTLFGTEVAYAVGSGPYAVAVGDFNLDGKPDIVAVNHGDNTVSVLLGYGNGTLFSQVVYAVDGTQPIGIAVGDFNLDGKPDVVVTNHGGGVGTTVSVLLGYGNGTLGAYVAYGVGSGPTRVAVGDFNLDGKPDVVATNFGAGGTGSTVSVLLGSGTGTFGTQVSYAAGSSPYAVAVADFNLDGKPDVVVTNNADATVSVLLGSGNGTLDTQVAYAAGSGPYGIAVGDFNLDGKPDVVATNQDGDTVSVLLGYGNGTLGTQVAYAVGNGPQGIAVGDFNLDGKPDVVVSNDGGNTVSLLLGYGNGTLDIQVAYAVGTSPYYLAVGDFNLDGKPDVVAANYANNTVSVLLNILPENVPGTLGTQVAYAVGTGPNGVAVGDFNLDGKPDVVAANFAGGSDTVSVLLGYANGTLLTQVAYAVGSSPHDVAVGDFNLDGKPDVVTANNGGNTISVLLGYGNGTLLSQVAYAVGTQPYSVTVGDFNLDGKPDVVVTNDGDNTVSVLLGSGTGTFGTQVAYAVGAGPNGVAVGDFNLDGKPDVVTANLGGNTVSVLLGYGNGTLGTQVAYAVGSVPYRVAVGDFNLDGKPDVVAANEGDNTVSVLLGYGNGTLESQVAYAVGAGPNGVAVGDFNLDGKPDVVAANYNGNTVSVLLGYGNGTLGSQVTYAVLGEPEAVAVGDFNLDGKPDVVAANYGGNTVSVLLNVYSTLSPTTYSPTLSPTLAPIPTASPSLLPTLSPTTSPTATPTMAPTLSPSLAPTLSPSSATTFVPTPAPSIPLGPTPSPTQSVKPIAVQYFISTNPVGIAFIDLRNSISDTAESATLLLIKLTSLPAFGNLYDQNYSLISIGQLSSPGGLEYVLTNTATSQDSFNYVAVDTNGLTSSPSNVTINVVALAPTPAPVTIAPTSTAPTTTVPTFAPTTISPTSTAPTQAPSLTSQPTGVPSTTAVPTGVPTTAAPVVTGTPTTAPSQSPTEMPTTSPVISTPPLSFNMLRTTNGNNYVFLDFRNSVYDSGDINERNTKVKLYTLPSFGTLYAGNVSALVGSLYSPDDFKYVVIDTTQSEDQFQFTAVDGGGLPSVQSAQVTVAIRLQPNIVLNPSFEGGLVNWNIQATGSAAFSVVNANANNMLQMSRNSTSDSCILLQTLSASVINRPNTFQLTYKTSNILSLQYDIMDSASLLSASSYKHQITLIPDNMWHTTTPVTFMVNNNGVDSTLGIKLGSNATGTLDLDAITLSLGAPIQSQPASPGFTTQDIIKLLSILGSATLTIGGLVTKSYKYYKPGVLGHNHYYSFVSSVVPKIIAKTTANIIRQAETGINEVLALKAQYSQVDSKLVYNQLQLAMTKAAGACEDAMERSAIMKRAAEETLLTAKGKAIIAAQAALNMASEAYDMYSRTYNEYNAAGQTSSKAGEVELSDITEAMSPIGIAMGLDNIELVSLASSNVTFDYYDNGIGLKTAWVGPKDAFLIYDHNDNKQVDFAKELVLTQWSKAATTDFEALKEIFDSNNDNKFNANDTEFHKFMIWQDKNQDGGSQSGELTSLTDSGLVEIDFNTEKTLHDEFFGEQQDMNVAEVSWKDGHKTLAYDLTLEASL